MRNYPPRLRHLLLAALATLGLMAGVTFGASPVSAATASPSTPNSGVTGYGIAVQADAPVAKAVGVVESPSVAAAVAAPSVAAATPTACGVPNAKVSVSWGCGRAYRITSGPLTGFTAFAVDDRLEDGMCVSMYVKKRTGQWYLSNTSCGAANMRYDTFMLWADVLEVRISTSTSWVGVPLG